MSGCEEQEVVMLQEKRSDGDRKVKGVDRNSAAEGSRNANSGVSNNNKTTAENNNKKSVECCKGDSDIDQKQQRLPPMNSRRQKTLMKLEQRIEDWKKSEQMFASVCLL